MRETFSIRFVLQNNWKGLHVDTGKVKAITKQETPENPIKVRRFIGILEWYRKVEPNSSVIIAPLTKLIQKKVPFK